MSELLTKIQSRLYWKVIIRPCKFIKNRVQEIVTLNQIIENNSVEVRGWNFPHLAYDDNPKIDIDFISLDFEWEQHLEVWRFYQSGLFWHVSGSGEDWRDQSTWWPPHENWSYGKILWIDDTLFRFTEIFDFASRLAITEAGNDNMHIEVGLHGLNGRRLASSPNRFPVLSKTASIDSFPQEIEITKTKLLSKYKELALNFSVKVFQRFNWNPNIDILRDIQRELYRK